MKFLPSNSRKMLYKAFIMPHLDYCQVLYNPCSRVLCEHLERIQNYAIRLITGNPPRTSSAPLRQNLGLTTLRADSHNNSSETLSSGLCASVNVRQICNKLQLRLQFKGAVLYNSLPESIRTVPTERSLRSALLSISDIFDQ